MTWFLKILLVLKAVMIFEKANKQTSFSNTLINQIRAASHWLTYLISPRQPWGNLPQVTDKWLLSFCINYLFPMIHPKTSLTSGLPFQKALAAKNWFLFIHSCSIPVTTQVPKSHTLHHSSSGILMGMPDSYEAHWF